AVHVRLELGLLVVFGALPERVATKAQPGGVEEDVDPAQLADDCVHELPAAVRIRDVELVPEVPFEPFGPPSADGDPGALLPEEPRSRRADPAGPARDHRDLAVERAHARSLSASLRPELNRNGASAHVVDLHGRVVDAEAA